MSPDGYIALVPSDRVDVGLIGAVRAGIADLFGFPVKIEGDMGDIAFAFDEERNQYHSTAILEKLAGRAAPDAVKVLGITDVDLFIPILTYVHGEAQLGGKAGIISTFRLKGETADRESFVSRVVKEARHELTHCFDLRHCKESSCLMHFCRDASAVDKRSDELCRYCRVMLEDGIKRLEREVRRKKAAGLSSEENFGAGRLS